MAAIDLRPLSVGEILDRTFTVYRGYFVLFAGMTAVPQIFVLAFQLLRLFWFTGIHSSGRPFTGLAIGTLATSIVVLLISFVATLFSQAATILGVSDLYLGRPVTIANCLRRASGEIGTVFIVGLLNGLAVVAGLVALIVPGIYILCRFVVAVPAALIEQRSGQEALRRSWHLTRENTGRAFLLILLYFVISFAAGLLIGIPGGIAAVMNRNSPSALQIWLVINQVGSSLVNILIQPVLLIATSLFYFDLRVRKEAFDLQFMMDPNSERQTPPGTCSVPSIL